MVQGRKVVTNMARSNPVTQAISLNTRQLVKRRRAGRAEEAAGPRSLSLAAARVASARRPPARTRWRPGFRSLDPGHSMKGWQIIG